MKPIEEDRIFQDHMQRMSAFEKIAKKVSSEYCIRVNERNSFNLGVSFASSAILSRLMQSGGSEIHGNWKTPARNQGIYNP